MLRSLLPAIHQNNFLNVKTAQHGSGCARSLWQHGQQQLRDWPPPLSISPGQEHLYQHEKWTRNQIISTIAPGRKDPDTKVLAEQISAGKGGGQRPSVETPQLSPLSESLSPPGHRAATIYITCSIFILHFYQKFLNTEFKMTQKSTNEEQYPPQALPFLIPQGK